MTELLLFDLGQGLPNGLRTHAGSIGDRAWVEEYELIINMNCAYVMAHSQHESGPIRSSDTVHR